MEMEVLDFDRDGHDEIWIHSSHFSALVSPEQGGAIVEYTVFDQGINYADVLTRRREAYHYTQVKPAEESHDDDGGIASIHHLEESMILKEPPPIDSHDRAITFDSVRADQSFRVDKNEIVLEGNGIEKRLQFTENGEITIHWKWNPPDLAEDFWTEVSSTRPLTLDAIPRAAQSRESVETVAKSEKGFDRTVQGEAVTLRWNRDAGSAELRIRPY